MRGRARALAADYNVTRARQVFVATRIGSDLSEPAFITIPAGIVYVANLKDELGDSPKLGLQGVLMTAVTLRRLVDDVEFFLQSTMTLGQAGVVDGSKLVAVVNMTRGASRGAKGSA